MAQVRWEYSIGIAYIEELLSSSELFKSTEFGAHITVLSSLLMGLY
jgi:hypothetical protein